MITPKVLVLRSPGTNCDEETAFAGNWPGGELEHHRHQYPEDRSLRIAVRISSGEVSSEGCLLLCEPTCL